MASHIHICQFCGKPKTRKRVLIDTLITRYWADRFFCENEECFASKSPESMIVEEEQR